MGSMMSAAWLFGLLLAVGIVVLVVLGVLALTRGVGRDVSQGRSTSQQVSAPGRSAAVQILDERFARGDLSAEEYRERLGTLGEDA